MEVMIRSIKNEVSGLRVSFKFSLIHIETIMQGCLTFYLVHAKRLNSCSKFRLNLQPKWRLQAFCEQLRFPECAIKYFDS